MQIKDLKSKSQNPRSKLPHLMASAAHAERKDCRLLVADGSVVPHSYSLLIAINLDDGATFEGCAEIGVECCGDNCTSVTIHQLGLDVSRIEWVKSGPAREVVRVPAKSSTVDTVAQTMTCFFDEGVMSAGKGCLLIQWSAPLSDGLCGLYKSTFVNNEGVERVMAVTQFEVRI